jgi:hypothetical protein
MNGSSLRFNARRFAYAIVRLSRSKEAANVLAARLARPQMNVDYGLCGLIESFISQTDEAIEIDVVMPKPELRLQTKRRRGGASSTS